MLVKNMPVWLRLTISYVVLLILLLIAGGTGILGTEKLSRQIITSIETDGVIASTIAEISSHALGLRRYEKDIFLRVMTS